MASVTVGENQLQRIIRDLHDAVSELAKEHDESGEPITDDSTSLHKFSYKLEYLLQFDQKEKTSFLGGRKDYWDYFCECLSNIKGTNDGIHFVKSISELKTSLGKGRAFIRYCLVHQRLADTLQQCLMNQRVTCDWYYARSPFLKSHLNVDLINHLYELNEIQFDVASRGYDLDSEWPTFARRTVGSGASASHFWRTPSRCSSVNSLISSFSQQTNDFHPGPDVGVRSVPDLEHLGELPSNEVDDLRVELDQSELQKRQLLEQVELLKHEVDDLQEKLTVADKRSQEPETTLGEEPESQAALKKTYDQDLEERLHLAEKRNMELLAKLDGILSEKDTSSDPDTEMLSRLKVAELEKLDAKQESESWKNQAEKLTKELESKEERLKETEKKLANVQKDYSTCEVQQVDELQTVVKHLRETLSLKEQEMENVHTQLQDSQNSLKSRDQELDEVKKQTQDEYHDLKQKSEGLKEKLQSQILSLQELLETKDVKLSICRQKITQLEEQKLENQDKKLEEYKAQCASLMEINAKLIHTVKKSEESNRELVQTKATLEEQLTSLKASKKQLSEGLDSSDLSVEQQEESLMLKADGGEVETKRTELEKKVLGAPRLEQYGEPDTEPNYSDNLPGLLRDVQDEDLKLVQQCTTGKAERRLALAEAQLELNMKEVSRLQEEVVDLRAQLQVSSEERMKIQALHEVTGASREDLYSQTEHLKSHVEELNCRHIEELLQHQEKEEALAKELTSEAQTLAARQAEVTTMKEELHVCKRQNDTLALENEEARETLHRANTEIAELGVQVCRLTGLNEEAKLQIEELLTKQLKLEENQKELQNLMDSLTREKASLLEELKQVEGLPKATQELKQRLQEAKEETMSLRKSNQKEISAVRLQLSEATKVHQNQIKALNDELLGTKSHMEAEQKKVSTLETRLAELEMLNSSYIKKLEEKNSFISKSELLLLQKEEKLIQLHGDLTKAQEELTLTQKSCQELSENLQRTVREMETERWKASAEMDDLNRTKRNLEERLIELIREKDVLWQKSDALEFERKLRVSKQQDREVPHCSECHSQFSWWLRRHICRLCGRSFCYYCCSYTVSSQQSVDRERCCKDCVSQHSGAESHLQQDLGSPSRSSYSPLASTPTRGCMPSVTVTPQSNKPDDAAFDIITDEEVNCIHENDSRTFTTAEPTERLQEKPPELSSSISGGDLTADESEDLLVSAQDTETCLLKSGEITFSVSLNLEDIIKFGVKSREIFIKSSSYSQIIITASTTSSTVRWEFSSTPKSVSFCVLYRESAEAPLTQTKVLIPLTRCKSHKERIQGQVKVRHPGQYLLIFDNSFSRFISKTVVYDLSADPADDSESS